MNTKEKIEKLLQEISENDELSFAVFHGDCIYFIINDGEILEIPDVASCSPRGGWFPSIVNGLTETEHTFIKELMKKYSFNYKFFNNAIGELSFSTDNVEIEENDLLEYFKDEEPDNYNKVINILNEYKESNIFDDLSYFIDCVRRYNLESNSLYYWWNDLDDYIDLYENICESGEPAGEYDCYSDEEWLDVLENIYDYIV